MIKSFTCKETEALFKRQSVRKLPADLLRTALRKLKIIDAALDLNDLTVPPSNRLERLKGERKGQYSIRINDQWRICFKFEKSQASDVEIVDYH